MILGSKFLSDTGRVPNKWLELSERKSSKVRICCVILLSRKSEQLVLSRPFGGRVDEASHSHPAR